MKKIVPVIIGVIADKTINKFLLTKRKEVDFEDKEYGECWHFPGGGIEFGEDPKTALNRELLEEIGVKVNILELVPEIFSPVRNNWQGILICYLCVLSNRESVIKLNHEATRYDWFTLKEIKSLPTLPFAYEIARCASNLL